MRCFNPTDTNEVYVIKGRPLVIDSVHIKKFVDVKFVMSVRKFPRLMY